jgi:deoxyribose-phosphate aldolase
MHIRHYLDSTYLKLPEQAGLSKTDHLQVVRACIQEAIEEKFKLVMIRPDMVSMARTMIDQAKSTVLVGTVIGFPEGTANLEAKLQEAQQAIEDGADELDFVCNYPAFQSGDVALVRKEIVAGTQLAWSHHKTVKWIIEVAALTDAEIIQLSACIKNTIIAYFKEEVFAYVFVKSSTGFYETKEGKPNGATHASILMMLENCAPLPVKAAGGVRTYEEAVEMIKLGVKRIGTSVAKTIAQGGTSDDVY